MKVSTDFMIESELGLQTINVTIQVKAAVWEQANSISRLKPAVDVLRKHRPFPTYQIINVSQTVIDPD